MISKKYIRIIIPIVAVLVLVESVVLVNSLENQKIKREASNKPDVINVDQVIPEVDQVETNEDVTLKLEAEKLSLNVGQESFVDVMMSTSVSKSFDAVSVYVDVDTQKVALERVEINNSMPKPIVAKISKKGNVALVNYLISSPSGYRLASGDRVAVARIYFTPIDSGKTSFKILGEEVSEAESMLVETGTSKVIPFNSGDLSVSILK
jgi:hypothetical protein